MKLTQSKMAKRKKRKTPAPSLPPPPAKKKKVKLTECAVIKRSLKSAMKQPYDESVELNLNVPESERTPSPLRQEIQRIVIEITKMLKAGSLNVHVSLYSLFQNGTRAEIEAEFTKHVNKDFFTDYFRGLTMIRGDVDGYILNDTVRRLCLQYEIDPPDIGGLGNIVNFACQKYCVNFMNSICVHAYTRIRKYFLSKTRSKTRVYDTLHYLFHVESEKEPDPDLIEALVQLRPIKFGDGAGYFCDMQKKWYQYVPLFMELQG